MSAPAGWFPDPDGWGGQRYFDGRSWTAHRTPAAVGEHGPAWDAPTAPLPAVAAPAAAEPSGRRAKVAVGVIAAVVVLAMIGVAVVAMTHKHAGEVTVAGKPSDASAHTPVVASPSGPGGRPEQGAPTLEDRAPAGVGQPVRDGNFEFVVTGIDRAPVVADAQFPDLQKAAQGEYLLVKTRVTNIGTRPQMFFASFNTLSDGTNQFRSDDEAWVYLGNSVADINPGDSIETSIVYDVPVGTAPASIELHDGPFSEGVTVGL